MFEGIFFEFPKVISFLFIFLACEALCRLRHQGFYFPHLAAFAAVTLKPSFWLWLLKWASILLLLVALMSPVKEQVYQPVSAPGYAISLVVDASASMRNGDFDPDDRTRSRFEAVQEILQAFVAQRSSDSVGLVVFGTHTFTAAPPTSDMGMLSKIIGQLYVGIAGKYTALYEAMARGIVSLHDVQSTEKIVVVLTDGRNTPGAPVGSDVVGGVALKDGVRLYAVVVGDAPEDAPAAQESVLKTLTAESGGAYFTARNTTSLADVYAQIDALEKSPQRPPVLIVKEYYYVYPLFAGFMTLLLYVYLRNRRLG
ncbi:VWA domain-containing protein [Sulfurimonas sp. HSL1-2]|uniref:vWA domain-containing protein n=1 Tax=Thiomicrolovo zhangzhouensis TaxID=3131933 RepID=UPI0031F95A74